MTPTEQLLRDALKAMLDEYETLHSLYNLGECQATVDARTLLAATSQQAEGEPTDEQVEAAIAAYDAAWTEENRGRRNIFEAMKAALRAAPCQHSHREKEREQ